MLIPFFAEHSMNMVPSLSDIASPSPVERSRSMTRSELFPASIIGGRMPPSPNLNTQAISFQNFGTSSKDERLVIEYAMMNPTPTQNHRTQKTENTTRPEVSSTS